MKLNNETQEIVLEVHHEKQMTDDLINQFKEYDIQVPDVIVAMYEVDAESLEKLHAIGVKRVYHSLTQKEIKGAQRAMLGNVLDDVQHDIEKELESLDFDIHSRVSKISDKLYNTINLYDDVEFEGYKEDEFA